MPEEAVRSRETDLDGFVTAFEDARAQRADADFADFLPDCEHPLYRDVLRELVRVDMELGWTDGQPTDLDEYRLRFPRLFEHPDDIQAIAFEEFRLRCQVGDRPVAEHYRRRFGVDVRSWPGFESSAYSQLQCGSRNLPATRVVGDARPEHNHNDRFPRAGETFLGFQLRTELGRGSFARVFLALQGELADRYVVLKISRELVGESRMLAQLQHANIVPIYSIHHAGPRHAVCMPYFGATTLADVLAQLRQAGGLPASGQALVATMKACRSRTHGFAIGMDSSVAGDCEHAPTHQSVELPVQQGDSGPNLTTLAGLNYVQAVLWIASRLADGLAHAHDRGILHRDLKPANILLADDGQPMLLDFNLSEDTKLQAPAESGKIGGTLPYMAPEHLAAFRDRGSSSDVRSDIYSLGVILYELLAGVHPYPVHTGPAQRSVPLMIDDRRQPPARLQPLNPSISPAVESIVLHCLATEPARRYPSAHALKEDLQRQLDNRPLKYAPELSWRERASKWARRHPRLSSASSVIGVTLVLLLALGAWLAGRGERLARLEAAEAAQLLRQDLRTVQVGFLETPARGTAHLKHLDGVCRQTLERFGVLDDLSWHSKAMVRNLDSAGREQLADNAGELLFLLSNLVAWQAEAAASITEKNDKLREALAFNDKARSCLAGRPVPKALQEQRASLAAQLKLRSDADLLPRSDDDAMPASVRDKCLLACFLTANGRFRAALPLWQQASLQDPQNVWAWYGLANCHDALKHPTQAASCYSACIALSPDFAGWYFQRGLANLKLKEFAVADMDFTRALELEPDRAEAFINRALARMGENRWSEADRDLSAALDLDAAKAQTYFLRAQVRDRRGDRDGAETDRKTGLHKEPSDEAAWLARGLTRIARQPEAALADFDRALKDNPRSLPALENKAHVLAEKLGRSADAVLALNQAIALRPEEASLRAARGVLLARLGKPQPALGDAVQALALESSPAVKYQVAGIYALTADRSRALSLLAAAVRQGYGEELLDVDTDLDPIRSTLEFQQLAHAVRSLREQAAAVKR